MEHETMTDTPKHEIVDLPVKDISYDPAKRLRKVGPNKVAELKKSIAEFGLLEPIGVTRAEEEGKYLLRYGAHRFEVVKELKWKIVTSNILDLGSTAACIAEIDENLMIAELTPTQRSDHIAKRKVLYELLHPETKKGNAQATGMRRTAKLQSAAPDSQIGSEVVEDPPKQPSFMEDTAAQTGLSPTTIARDVERSTKVTEVAKAQIEGTPLDTGKVLDELKQLPPDEQLPRVQELMEERKQPKKPRQKKPKQSKQPSKSEMLQDWLPSRLKVGERGITQEDINEAWMRALEKAWKPVRELWKGEFPDALRRKFVLKVEHDLEQNGLSGKIWRKREERDAKFEDAVERHRAAEEARADAGGGAGGTGSRGTPGPRGTGWQEAHARGRAGPRPSQCKSGPGRSDGGSSMNTLELAFGYRDAAKIDQIDFVWSVNIHRRHLTRSQREASAADLANMKLGDNQHSSKEGRPNGTPSKQAYLDANGKAINCALMDAIVPRQEPVSIKVAAKKLGVSEGNVRRAAAVKKDQSRSLRRPQGGQDHDRRGGKEGQENAKFQRRKPGPRRRKSGETPKTQGTPVSLYQA
jgi:hypothetical protein